LLELLKGHLEIKKIEVFHNITPLSNKYQ